MAAPTNPNPISPGTSGAPADLPSSVQPKENTQMQAAADKVTQVTASGSAASITAVPTAIPASQADHKSVADQIHSGQYRQLQKITADHPSWGNIISSMNASIDDKLWLLWVYELHELGVPLPHITTNDPQAEVLNKKAEIQKALAEITDIDWLGKNLNRCPDAIRLLVNLENLNIGRNNLKIPPDTSQNSKLKRLYVFENHLTVAPDTRHNPELTELNLTGNKITTPPDLSPNSKLEMVWLNNNQLTEASDVTKNRKLLAIYLQNNKIAKAPDFSKNNKLTHVDLGNNKLKTAPALPPNLRFIDLRENPLSENDKAALAKGREFGKDMFL